MGNKEMLSNHPMPQRTSSCLLLKRIELMLNSIDGVHFNHTLLFRACVPTDSCRYKLSNFSTSFYSAALVVVTMSEPLPQLIIQTDLDDLDFYGKVEIHNRSVQEMGKRLIEKIQKMMQISNSEFKSCPNPVDIWDYDQVAEILAVRRIILEYHLRLVDITHRMAQVKIPRSKEEDSLARDLASLSLPDLTPSMTSVEESWHSPDENSPSTQSEKSTKSSKKRKIIVEDESSGQVIESEQTVVEKVLDENDFLPPNIKITNLSPGQWALVLKKMEPRFNYHYCYVTMAYIESLESFYVIYDQTGANELHHLLQTSISRLKRSGIKSLEVDQVNQGSLCAAVFSEDGCYYRGQIISVKDGDVEIYFIDYGNKERVEFSKLMPLEDSLRDRFPVQCIKCVLENFLGVVDNPNALPRFRQMTASQDNFLKGVFRDKKPKSYFWSNPLTIQLSFNTRTVDLYLCSRTDPTNQIRLIDQLLI